MACGGPDSASAPDTVAPPATSLVVEQGGQRVTLTCDPPGGDHPDPAAACRDLAAQDDPFAPVPADAFCTEQYGGPQTATVRGSYQGQPVDLSLSRVDGCRIAQWDRLGALLS